MIFQTLPWTKSEPNVSIPVEFTTVQTIQQRFAKCSQLSDQRRLAANMKVETDQHFVQVHSQIQWKAMKQDSSLCWKHKLIWSWMRKFIGLSWFIMVYHHSTEFFLSKLPESGGWCPIVVDPFLKHGTGARRPCWNLLHCGASQLI